MVIITRSDLTPGYQAQQSTHSIADFARDFPHTFTEWNRTSGSIVLLAVPNEQELEKLFERLSKKTDVTKFCEPDLNNELTSICLYASPEVRKTLSNLPLLGRKPKFTYESVISKMMDTPQTNTQSVLEHGMSVYKYFKDLYEHLNDGSELQYQWKLPEWLYDNAALIWNNLHDYETIKEYQLMHDCSKNTTPPPE